jgi:hypothetical protein
LLSQRLSQGAQFGVNPKSETENQTKIRTVLLEED